MNGWQGLTYLTLDLLEPFGMEYASAIEVGYIKLIKALCVFLTYIHNINHTSALKLFSL